MIQGHAIIVEPVGPVETLLLQRLLQHPVTVKMPDKKLHFISSAVYKNIKTLVSWIPSKLQTHQRGKPCCTLTHIDRMAIHKHLISCHLASVQGVTLVLIVPMPIHRTMLGIQGEYPDRCATWLPQLVHGAHSH